MQDDNALGVFIMAVCIAGMLAFGVLVQFQQSHKHLDYLFIKNYSESPGRIDLTLSDNSTRLCFVWYFKECRNNYNSLFACDKDYCAPVSYSWSGQTGAKN